MSWASKATTYSDTSSNRKSELDTDLDNFAECLTVMKYGYIPLFIGSTQTAAAAGGDYTEASMSVGTSGTGTKGQLLYAPLRNLGVSESPAVDIINFSAIQMPADAAAATATSIVLRGSLGTGTPGGLVAKVYFIWDIHADLATLALTYHTAAFTANTTLTDNAATSAKVPTMTVVGPTVSAGDMITLSAYRDEDDAADTFTGNVLIFGGYLRYERTI